MESVSTHLGAGECRDVSSLLRVCIRRVDSRSRHAFHADTRRAATRKGRSNASMTTRELLARQYNDLMRQYDNFTGRAVRLSGHFGPIWRYFRSK